MKNLSILPTTSIKNAMKSLDETAERCLIVIDKKNRLLGTITDGDIRRGILKGLTISQKVSNCYNAKPFVLLKNNYNKVKVLSLFKEMKLDLLPVVDKSNILTDVITPSDLGDHFKQDKCLINAPVVIMAGGKGTRLKPFTKILPKPLIPIHGKTILEHIINRFCNIGCNNFHMTVNYKAKIINAYFEELSPTYNVNFIHEVNPLGTAGGLRVLNKKITKTFFVTNCDILIDADYSNIYEFHKNGKYDLTLVASAKEHIVPYGTCELNKDGHLKQINEKPKFDFLINTGFYILEPSVLELIPKNTFFHITSLIELLKREKRKVGVYPIDDEKWIDIGQWSEYKKAVEKL